jgi:23S rRNA maturation mini-RNase III
MSQKSVSPINAIEMQEVIEKLRAAGYSEIVDTLLDNEKDCYTKRGRLNKSSTCRKLDWKSKKLEDVLKEMRELLRPDFPDLDGEEETES